MKIIFFFMAVIFCLSIAAGMILISYFFGPKKLNSVKLENFECGMPQATLMPKKLNINFYILAVLFLIFDIELIYLYPWAWGFENLTNTGFYAGIVFILILFITTIYIIRRNILKWD
ncbi:MAG: NADH-quinone oxidoreductase subunit A [Elusimicrobiales bacterium]|nr:NADH-quinone oxidoreductase subunit A [Elusimicrobiales bacterium]